jgi:CheY-like chemotaxis protein
MHPVPSEDSRIRVLIADDDRPFLRSLQELIERQPELHVIGAAANGLEAIELADQLIPDAVVLDLHMPLLDGVSAASRLRRDHPSPLSDRPDGRRGAGTASRGPRSRRGRGAAQRRARREAARAPGRGSRRGLMARAGIEPATPRFSAVCSTN